MANTNLKEAKAAKNDEFYTQFHDIEIEMNAYLEYDPDVFRGKTILLPCDDPEWSNFTRYFAAKFEELGIKKLISTSYAPDALAFVLYGNLLQPIVACKVGESRVVDDELACAGSFAECAYSAVQ